MQKSVPVQQAEDGLLSADDAGRQEVQDKGAVSADHAHLAAPERSASALEAAPSAVLSVDSA